MAFAVVFLALVGQSPSPPTPRALHVLISDADPCRLRAPVAARLRRTPGLVVTTTASTGERLDALRRSMEDPTYAVALSAGEDPPVRATVLGPRGSTSGAGDDVDTALERAWPSYAAALGRPVLAPNPEALAAACARDVAAAWRRAGPALGTLLPELVAFPAARSSGPVFERWAYARSERAQGRGRRALAAMRQVVSALERGEWAPSWLQEARSSTLAPSALAAGPGEVYAFGGGVFNLLEPETGRVRWRREVGRAEPRPTLVDARLALLLAGDLVHAVDPSTPETKWTLDLPGAHPEVAARASTVFLAGESRAVAVDRASGATRWSVELLKPPTAGPVDVGFAVALPLEHSIRLLALEDGRTLRQIELADEISAPLVVTARGNLWTWIGSEEVQQLDPRRGTIRARIVGLDGAAWPPVSLGEQVVLLTQGRRPRLHWLDPAAPDDQRLQVAASAPLVLRPDFAGVLYIDAGGRRLLGRGPGGEPNLRLALPGEARALATYGSRAVVGWRDRVLVVDLDRGRRLHEVRLGAPIDELVLGPRGGAARLSDGTLVGWPSPGSPTPQAWLQEARRELARAALAAGRFSEAREAAEAALARSPMDMQALALRAHAAFAGGAPDGAALQMEVADIAPRGSQVHADAIEAVAPLGLKPAAAPVADPATAPRSVRAAWLRLESSSVSRSSTATTGPAVWRVKLDFTPVHASADEDVVAVASTKRVALLSSKSGRLEWTLPIAAETIVDLEFHEGALLVWTDRGLHGVDLATGRRRGRLRLDRPPERRARVGDIALIHDGQTLTALDVGATRRLGRIELSGATELSVLDARIHVRLDGDRWWRVDPLRGLGGP